jgi:hypothetical protein
MERIVVFTLRLAELAFAAIVAGVNGEYLHSVQGVDSWVIGRSIYAEVVAGISLFFALIWLIPFSYSLTNWPLDVIISLCWWAVFGLLVDVCIRSPNKQVITKNRWRKGSELTQLGL